MRAFFQDWASSYAGLKHTAEESRDLGNAVKFAVILQKRNVAGRSASLELRCAGVAKRRDGLIVRNITYTDIDAGRVATKRLAEQQG